MVLQIEGWRDRWKTGGRRGGGFEAFCLHPAVVQMNNFCRRSLFFSFFEKHFKVVATKSSDDEDRMFILFHNGGICLSSQTVFYAMEY